MTVYLQWMNTRGIVSPIYKTTTKSDGTYIFDLSEPVELVTGKTASFNPSEGQNFLVRTWVKNPDPRKYSVVKNGDMFSGGYHHRLKRKQESWDFTVGIERIVNANIQLEERPNVEGWLAKPKEQWVRAETTDGIWPNDGDAGVVSGRIWYEVGELAGGSPNEYLYDKSKGDLLVPKMEVVASYVNDDVAREFDKWKKDNNGFTIDQFKAAQKEIIDKYDSEHGKGSAIAETVVGTTDSNGDYRIPFRGLYGVSRDRQNPIAAISNKVSNEEYGQLVKPEEVQHKDTRHWDGIVNLKARHINLDYMYVYPIVEEQREVWMKMFENNMFQTMNSIGGVLLAGYNMRNVQFALLAPRPIHDVTNYDTIKNFASEGNTADSKTTGLVPGNTYQVQWFKDGKPVGEPTTMTADANGEFGSVPVTVEEGLTQPAVYTSAVFPGEGSTKSLGDALYSDSFVADPTPGVRLHRNLTEDDKAGNENEVVKTVKANDISDTKVQLPKLHDTEEYTVDEATNKYFVGWATEPDATEPDANTLLTDEEKEDPKADLYVRDGSEYPVEAKKVKDLYAVWKDPFKITAKKEWDGANVADYDTSKLKFGLLYRPALGAYGQEIVKSLATYKPYYNTDADIKDYNAEGMTWENIPSYNVDGKRYTYILVELSNEKMLEAFKAGSTDWDTYQVNIVEGQEAQDKGKKQTVYVENKKATDSDKLDAFSSATVRKHVDSKGNELNNPKYFDTEGYDITATNKKFDIKPPVVEKAKEGDTKVTISHEENGIEEFKGTMKVGGKETTFTAKRNPADNTWTITDKEGNAIPGVTVDNSNPSDNTLVLNTPALQDGDFVNAKAVRRDVASPEDVMNVTGSKAKLPTDIKQEYSENPNNAVITAKPAMTTDENGNITGLANPNAEYTLVDQDGNAVSEPVKANGDQIKFDVSKDKLSEDKEYSIKVSIPGKDDNNTNTVDAEPSTNGTPSDRSVKVDITAPSGTLPDIKGKVGDVVNKEVSLSEPATITKKTTPTGVNVTADNSGETPKLNVTGSIDAPVNEKYSVEVKDKFGNAATLEATIKALPKVTQSIPEGADSNLYSKITFKPDDHSKLRDKNDGENYVLYVLKDFDEDGSPDTSISLAQLKEAGFSNPNYDIEEGYKFDKWEGMSLNIDPSKDTVITLKTKFDVYSLNDPAITPVKDTSALTDVEKDAVKKAVKDANPNLPADAEITVANDGTVTVKVGDEEKVFEPTKTVEAKEGLKVPEKTPVIEPKKLTEDEKNLVKEAVKKANPDLPTDAVITVEDNGRVTVRDKDGNEIGTFEPEDTITSLNAPEKTKVKDPTKLTEVEKNAVKDAVKEANPSLPDDAEVNVADDGTVTVKDNAGKEIGTLEPKQTVEQEPTINKPVAGDKTVSGEGEPGEKITVTFPDGKTAEVLVGNDGKWTAQVPEGTELNANDVVKAEQNGKEVSDTVSDKDTGKSADPTIDAIKSDDDKITGTGVPGAKVFVKIPGVQDSIEATVANDGKWSINIPVGVELSDGTVITANQEEPGKAVSNPVTNNAKKSADPVIYPVKPGDREITGKGVPGATVEEDGNWKVTPNNPLTDNTPITATQTEPGKGVSDEAIEKVSETLKLKDFEKTPVKNPEKLTTKEKQAVKDAIKKTNPDLADNQITVDEKGNVIVEKDGQKIDLTPDKTVYTDKELKLNEPEITKVKDTNSLTPEEKKAVEDAVRKANPKLSKYATITVLDNGFVEVKDGDKVGTIDNSKTVETIINNPEKTIVSNQNKLTDAEKDAVKEAVKKANPNLPKGSTIEVAKDGTVTIKDSEGREIGTISGKKTVTEGLKDPEVTRVIDPNKLTDAEKDAVKEAVKKANPSLTDDQITVDDKGNVKVTVNGKEEIIPAERTVTSELNTPDKTVVKDTSDLTPAEKDAVKEAVKKANPNLPSGSTIEVSDDGTVTVINGNGDVIGTILGYKTVTSDSIIRPIPEPEVNDPNWDDYLVNNEPKTPTHPVFARVPENPTIVEDKEVKDTEKVVSGDHKKYVSGYPDGTFKPEGQITRAEAASMIARLAELDLSNNSKPEFKDVKDAWYNSAINVMIKMNLMLADKDGNFRPDEAITRAEFARALQFIDEKNDAVAPFADVKGHEFEEAINQAYGNGRLKGYPDGTFKPDAQITRAEAVTILNNYADRAVDKDGVKNVVNDLIKFTDLTTEHWAYYEIMEAANSHDYLRADNKGSIENWKALNK